MTSRKDCFTFIWKIENFSMCPQKQKECIMTPIFLVESLHKSSWQLRLFPKGEKRADYMACFLKRSEAAKTSKDLNLYVRFSLLCVDSERNNSRLFQCKFNQKGSLGVSDFVPLEDFRNHTDAYSSNDTLTVKCEMWDPKLNNQACGPNYHTTQCSVQTRIRTGEKSVAWSIQKFSNLQLHQKLSRDVVSILDHNQNFLTLSFYLTGECENDLCGQIEIQKDKNFSEQFFVKCQVMVPDESKKYKVEDAHLFESGAENDVWKLPTFIQCSSLIKDKYLDATGDVLHLLFRFTYSRLEDMYHASSDESLPSSCFSIQPCKTHNPFQNEFKNLYEDGKFSDLTLVVESRKFKVHKNILSTRSSVFSTLFETAMNEEQTRVVVISDLEADTLDLMLSFMYTDILNDISAEEALKLYYAADMYAVLPLKYRCRCILKNSINLSNVCNILNLASLHKDEDLFDTVLDFVRANSKNVFVSQEWRDFTTSNVFLAARVMHIMLI